MKKLILLLIVCTTLLVQKVSAAKYTWTGATSTNWTVSTNWSPNGVPLTTDTVKIVSITNNPVLQANTTVKELEFTSGSLNLNTYSLTVSNNCYFYAGTISNGNLIIRGTYSLFNGTTFSCTIDAIVGRTVFSGGTFNSAASFEQTSASNSNGAGGCTFNGAVTIKKTGNSFLNLGMTNADVFNDVTKIINTSTYAIQLGFNTVSSFNDSLILESTGAGGVNFATGSASGGATLASGKVIRVGTGGFTNGSLVLKNFTQNGSTAQSITATGSAIVSLVSSTFNGALTISSPGILLKTSTFNGVTEFIKSGTSSNQSDGGNTFNAAVTFRNTASNTASFRLALQDRDIFNSDVTFITTNGYISPAFNGISEFKGNVSINSNLVVFNLGTGTVSCTGYNNQTFSGTANYAIGKLLINKPSGSLNLSRSVTLDSSLTLTSGKVISSTTNLLSLKASCVLNGGNVNSFIGGPIKRTGISSFTYPVGKDDEYNPLTLGINANNTDAFQVEFFNTGQSFGTNKDNTLSEVNKNMYWSCSRTNGTSLPNLTLSWNSNNFIFAKPQNMKVTYWNNTTWKDKGQNSSTGNALQGTITSAFDQNGIYYTLGSIIDTSTIINQNYLKDIALLGLDSIKVSNTMQIVGNLVTNKYFTNIYANDTLTSNSGLIDSINNEFASIYSSIKGKSYSNSINADGMVLNSGGFYNLTLSSFTNGLTLNGDSTTKYYIKSSGKFTLGSGGRIKINDVLNTNVYWVFDTLVIDSLSEMNGVVFCANYYGGNYNLGRIQLLPNKKVVLSNSASYNDYIYIHNYNSLNKLKNTITCSTNSCNLICNGDLEQGTIPISAGNILSATNWGNTRSNITISCSGISGNTPDIMDVNVLGSSYTCGSSQNGGVGIPLNFASNNDVNVRISGTQRYMHMIEREMADAKLVNSLDNRKYLIDYYYASSSCDPINGLNSSSCISLLNSTTGTFSSSLGNYIYDSSIPISFPLGHWAHAFSCIDLYPISNVASYDRISIRGVEGQVGDIFLDDFNLNLIARNAGVDEIICNGDGYVLGVLDHCIASIPDLTVTYNWTSTPPYNWTSNDNELAQPLVYPTVTTTFTLTTTISYIDGNGNTISCSDNDEVLITPVACCSLLVSASTIAVPCYNQNNGIIGIQTTLGLSPYSYVWSNGSASGTGNSTNTNWQINNLAPGSYVVTVTDANGCTSQASINISSLPNTIGITVNPSTQICELVPVQLTASTMAVSGTYFWSTLNQGTFSCNNCATTTFTPAVSQAVNLTFSGPAPNNCVINGNTFLTVNPAPPRPIISSPLTNCEVDNRAFVTNVNAGFIYSCVVTDISGSTLATPSGTSVTFNPSWPTPFVVTFTVTNPSTGCSSSTFTTVYGCCVGGVFGTLNLDMSNTNWSTILGNSLWTNSPFIQPAVPGSTPVQLGTTWIGARPIISINGTFTVNQDMIIQNAELLMGPNAQIIVNPGKHLLIGEGVYIHSCDEHMWRGIITTNASGTSPSHVSFTTGGSIIEDALTAIEINSPSYIYSVEDVIYNKNWRSIVFNGIAGTPDTDILRSEIFNSTFTSRTSQTLASDELISLFPHINQIPACAIEVNNVESLNQPPLRLGETVAVPLQEYNFISNMAKGFVINNSSVTINVNDFFAIRQQPFNGGDKFDGSAIFINNRNFAGVVNVGSQNVANPSLFSNDFESCDFGVLAVLSQGDLNINNNVDLTSFPINQRFKNITRSGVMTINCRDLNLNISNNSFNNCSNAISTRNTSVNGRSYLIENNEVLLPNRAVLPANSAFTGITMEQTSSAVSPSSCQIQNNLCQGQFMDAFILNNVSNVDFNNNIIRLQQNAAGTTELGLWMMGTVNCNIRENVFRNDPTQTNYFLKSNGIMLDMCGLNTLSNNSFHLLENHAWAFTSMTGTSFLCNKFNSGDKGLIINHSYVGPQGSSTAAQTNEWDITFVTATNIVGQNNYTQSNWYVQGSSGLPTDPLLQLPPIPNPNQPAVLVYNTQANTTLTCNQDPCPSCRISTLSNLADQFYDPYSNLLIEQRTAGMLQIMDEFIADSMAYFEENSEVDELLSKFHNDSITKQLYDYKLAFADLLMNDSNFAVINNTQGDNNFYLYNYDKLYEIAKSWKLGNEVSIGDSLFVVDLAKSNAYYTGPATFIARAMLGEYGEDEFINFNRILNFNKTDNKGLKVSPNPTNGIVKITFGKPTNQMELRNFMGQLVKSYSINNLEYIEIDINDLADGIYFINADGGANGIKLVKISK